jgi:Family of unknown function (DUF5317)
VALALVVLVGAAGIALLRGGSWNALTTLPLKGRRLIVIAVAAQLVGSALARGTGAHGFYPTGLAISALAALGFCWRNRRIAGVALVTMGLISNALVVLVNGAMPVSISAAARAGVSVSSIAAGNDPRHEIAGPHTTLRALGDIIPVPFPRRPEVDSPGDVLIAAGLGELVLLGMRPRRRHPIEPSQVPAAAPAVALR